MKTKSTKTISILFILSILISMFIGVSFLSACSSVIETDGRNFSISRRVNGNIDISWDAIEGAREYNIYRANSRLSTRTRIGTTRGTSFTDTSPQQNRFNNYYFVVPLDRNGASIVTLSWNYVDNAVSYRIMRYNPSFEEYVEIGGIEVVTNDKTTAQRMQIENGRIFIDYYRGFVFGQTRYRIVPLNAAGNPIMGHFDGEGWRQHNSGYQLHNIVLTYITPIRISFHRYLLGDNVWIFNPDFDDPYDIAVEVNRVADAMRTLLDVAQFSSERYAMYFLPGTYQGEGFERLNVGFYMAVNGLGRSPTDTRLHTTLESVTAFTSGNATHNFWRSTENLTIEGELRWIVSQAAPMRRLKVNGPTIWQEGATAWASGGFAADTYFNGPVSQGIQQQWYTRNSHFAHSPIQGVNWNLFTNASTGEAHANEYMQGGARQWINEGMEKMREKPFLYFDTTSNRFRVFVPAFRENAEGVSWTMDGPGEGVSLDLENDFFIAKPHHSTNEINRALADGRNLFFTPGMYSVDEPIFVGNEGAIVLGSGFSTIAPSKANTEGAMLISDVSGVVAAGFMLDAHFDSTYLLRIGENGSNNDHSHNPTFISDVFTRIGGFKRESVHSEVHVQINSNNVIGDHFWIWRADHGRGIWHSFGANGPPSETGHGNNWWLNTAPFGLVVMGDDVTMHGLFVEHFTKYQTIWMGERGRIFFYQNESPYEPPNQEAWRSHGGTVDGWAALKVCSSVTEFYAVGLGLYGVFNSYPVVLYNAIEVPHAPGVILRALIAVELGIVYTNNYFNPPGTPASQIRRGRTENIINGVGGPATTPNAMRVARFENGVGQIWTGTSLQSFVGTQPSEVDLFSLLTRVLS